MTRTCPCGQSFVPQADETECRLCTGVYTCSKCGEEWPNEEYYRNASRASGYASLCKACYEEHYGLHVRGSGWKRWKESAA